MSDKDEKCAMYIFKNHFGVLCEGNHTITKQEFIKTEADGVTQPANANRFHHTSISKIHNDWLIGSATKEIPSHLN
mgnify:CR=1 FL=1